MKGKNPTFNLFLPFLLFFLLNILLLVSPMAQITSTIQRMRNTPVKNGQQLEEVRSEPINNAGSFTSVDRIPVPTSVPTNRPIVLALPATNRNGNIVFPHATPNQNEGIYMEEANRIINSFRGGELQFIIDWYEHVQMRLEEIRRELDSAERQIPNDWKPSPGSGA